MHTPFEEMDDGPDPIQMRYMNNPMQHSSRTTKEESSFKNNL